MDNAAELFSVDPDLGKLGAVSYMGVPLNDYDGSVLGLLAVLDKRPLPEDPRALALFRIFAGRAGAELQRLRAEAEIREREEKMSQWRRDSPERQTTQQSRLLDCLRGPNLDRSVRRRLNSRSRDAPSSIRVRDAGPVTAGERFPSKLD